MGSKKHNKPYFVIGVLLVTVALLCFTKSHSSGLYMKASGDNYKTEDNLDNIKKRVSFEVDIPEYIKNLDNKNLQCEILMRQIVTANTDKYVLKIMKYVADDADPLALYENSKTDKKYSIKQKDSKINYFRYRQGYDKFPSCTLINWSTDETAYGFMLEDNMSEEDALAMLDIDSNSLSEYKVEQNNKNKGDQKQTDEQGYIEYNIKNILTFKIPSLKSTINQEDFEGESYFYIDSKLVFAIQYTNEAITTSNLDEQSKYSESSDLIIVYLTNNPFEKDSDAYSDYELIINHIKDIYESIERN